MKKILLIALFAMFAFSQGFALERNKDYPDTGEYTLDGTRAMAINGQFDDLDAYLDPIFFASFAYDPTCTGTGFTAAWRPYYDVYTFIANSNGFMDATLVVPNISCCDIGDPCLLLYCDPFDPNNAQSNLRACDDDDGISLNSAFTPAQGIELIAGQKYHIVATNLGDIANAYNGPRAYILTINSDVTMLNGDVPVANWPIILAVVAIAVLTIFLVRRRF